MSSFVVDRARFLLYEGPVVFLVGLLVCRFGADMRLCFHRLEYLVEPAVCNFVALPVPPKLVNTTLCLMAVRLIMHGVFGSGQSLPPIVEGAGCLPGIPA